MASKEKFVLDCLVVMLYNLSLVRPQWTSRTDNVCVYSFNIPRVDETDGGGSSGSRETSRLEPDFCALKATVNQQHDQMAAMMQQNGAMSQLITAQSQQIAAMAEDGKTNRQQITALLQREANRSMLQQDYRQTDNCKYGLVVTLNTGGSPSSILLDFD